MKMTMKVSGLFDRLIEKLAASRLEGYRTAIARLSKLEQGLAAESRDLRSRLRAEEQARKMAEDALAAPVFNEAAKRLAGTIVSEAADRITRLALQSMSQGRSDEDLSARAFTVTVPEHLLMQAHPYSLANHIIQLWADHMRSRGVTYIASSGPHGPASGSLRVEIPHMSVWTTIALGSAAENKVADIDAVGAESQLVKG